MSHIVDFRVTGLAGRDVDYSQKLHRDVNVFFGLNGAGKTSLLRILASAMSNNASSLLTVPFKSAEVNIYSITYKKAYRYTIASPSLSAAARGRPEAIQFFSDNLPYISTHITKKGELVYTPQYAWTIHPELPEPMAGRAWSHRFLPTTRMFEAVGDSGSEKGAPDEYLDLRFESTLQKYWSAFFGQLQLRAREIHEQGLADILNEVLTTGDDTKQSTEDLDWEVAYHRVSTFLRRQRIGASLPGKASFQARFQRHGLLRKVVTRIDQIEQQIAVAMAPRTKFEELVHRMFTGRKRLQFEGAEIKVVANDSTSIGLRSLSSGEKQILRILLETMWAGDSSLMIDEPELSMHIDWQRELVATMRELNPSAQLILATHSPEIMANIADSHVFGL